MSKLNSTEGPTTEGHQVKCVQQSSSTTLDEDNSVNNKDDLHLYKEIVPIVTVTIISLENSPKFFMVHLRHSHAVDFLTLDIF